MNGSSAWMHGVRDGDAAELHAMEFSAGRGVWLMRPKRPAFVLGSSQSADDIDVNFCAARGIDVARRRSGGGAVFVHPTESVWVDVTIPRGDALWLDDVGRAMHVVGRAWSEVLDGMGMKNLVVNEGPFVATEFSKQLCFAGRGSGEVFRVDDEGNSRDAMTKVIGISQRRTRDVARFQCIGYFAWNIEVHVGAITSLSDGSNDRPFAAPIPLVATSDLLDGLVTALARLSR
ncbi:MAG: lipoate--protein ligase family protein [Ilumatobacteraceae bacterium]|nr:lipoate--protein ligase family protein [Ilumatobacteraceae bacterium]